jgi:hypothetical protein
MVSEFKSNIFLVLIWPYSKRWRYQHGYLFALPHKVGLRINYVCWILWRIKIQQFYRKTLCVLVFFLTRWHYLILTYNFILFLNIELLNCKMIDISLFNNPLLSWDGILDFFKSRNKLSNIVLLILSQIFNGMNNPWLFFNNWKLWKVCAFCPKILLMISLQNIMFIMVDLRICILPMKYKICHHYLTCMPIQKLPWIKIFYCAKYEKKLKMKYSINKYWFHAMVYKIMLQTQL